MIKGYKGFNKDLQCDPTGNAPFRYEVGKGYEEDTAKCCSQGFHFCENPLDVLHYYSPAKGSRYCEVEGDGDISKDSGDSKVAVTKIKIGAELSLSSLIKAGVEFAFKKVKWDKSPAASTGYRSTAASTGDGSTAASNGDDSTAASNGDGSTAEAVGEEAVAISLGIDGTAKAGLGAWITLAEWAMDKDENFYRKWIKSRKVDGKSIKPGVLYKLKNGRFVKA